MLGDVSVDHALSARTTFNFQYQAMITRSAWNEIWGRPGLDYRTRRLLVLAICAAMSRWGEFRMHVRAGSQQGGFTQKKQGSFDADGNLRGVQAANTAFAEAAEVIAGLAEIGQGED